MEQNILDVTGIPDTTLNLQRNLSNEEKSKDSDDSNEDSEEEMSVDSENILIEEDLQDFEELNSIGQSGYLTIYLLGGGFEEII